MSAKAAATYHGRDIVDRLRNQAPYTEDGPTMRDAADEIERLRPIEVKTAEGLDALPNGIVVRSKDGTIAARYDSTRGVIFGDERTFPWKILGLPVTVLWQP